jgi:hypothetical protein
MKSERHDFAVVDVVLAVTFELALCGVDALHHPNKNILLLGGAFATALYAFGKPAPPVAGLFAPINQTLLPLCDHHFFPFK